eukprot:scaffold10.g2338.t1
MGSVEEWGVEQLTEWLHKLELPDHVVDSFKENAVTGSDLLELTDEDLTGELELKPLQVVKKIRKELAKLGSAAPPGAPPAYYPPPASAAPPPQQQQQQQSSGGGAGKAVAGAVLLTAPRRMARRTALRVGALT